MSDNDTQRNAQPSISTGAQSSLEAGSRWRALIEWFKAKRLRRQEGEMGGGAGRSGWGGVPNQINRLLEEGGLDDKGALANVARAYILHMRHERERALRWERVKRTLLVFLMISAGAAVWWRAMYSTGQELEWPWAGAGDPIIAVVEIRGVIAAQGAANADSVIGALNRASRDQMVRKILLYIDSPGGQPAEAERIADAVALLRERTDVPITAVAGNALASAAYLIAIEADRVVVPSSALVGSIGAAIPAWDASALLARIGVEQRQIESGDMKSMLSPFRPHTPQAQAKAQSLVNEMKDLFADRVERRRSAVLAVDRATFATGEVWMGASAVRMGLADEVGSVSTVLAQHQGLSLRSFGGSRQGGVSQWLRTQMVEMAQPF